MVDYKTINRIFSDMIDFYKGNLSDINHSNKVVSFALYIAEREGVSDKDLEAILISSILHDIACPLCREKYGNTNGKHQEEESEGILREFLKGYDLSDDVKERVIYLVSHHHSPQLIDNIDFQILVEADYMVNAEESGYSKENIRNTGENIFKTKSGKAILKKCYL